jgi:hypothetical protein
MQHYELLMHMPMKWNYIAERAGIVSNVVVQAQA